MPKSKTRAAAATLAALSFLLPQAARPQAREAIRVGGNVQEAKIIHRVEPVYPGEARAARVSGVVILQATVDETGAVTDVKVLRGHPLLDAAAVEAVRQWRYSPTYLNGEAVPVIATVTVVFSAQIVSVIMNASGVVTERGSGVSGEELQRKLAEAGTVSISLEPGIPSRVVEESVRALVRSGIRESRIKGACFFRDGRLYYGIDSPEVHPPELALDNERLAAIAREKLGASAPASGQPNLGTLLYQLYINEVGEVTGVERLRAPAIAEVEDELRRTRVVTPGRRGGDPVPVAVAVEVRADPREPVRSTPR